MTSDRNTMMESFFGAVQTDIYAFMLCALGFAFSMLYEYRKKHKTLAAKRDLVSPAHARLARSAASPHSARSAGTAEASPAAAPPADAEALLEVARLAAESSAEDVLNFYEAHLASCDLTRETSAVRVTVKSALQQKRMDIIESMLSRSWGTQGAALRELAESGSQDQLDQGFRAIPTKKAFHYNTVLDAMALRGDLETAERFLQRATAAGSADVVTYNTMVKAFSQRGRIKHALELISTMRDTGVPPNSVTFNQILDASARHGLGSSVWGVFASMDKFGVKPNYVTASIVLKLLQPTTPQADVDRAFGLLDAVEGTMDEVALGCVLEAGIRVKRPDILKRHLRKQWGANPVEVQSCHTYGSMIRAYGFVKDLQSVWRVWNELLERKIPWTCVTLGNMVEALAVNGDPHAAHKLVSDAASDPSKFSALTSVTFGSLLKGFAALKRFDDVWTVYTELKDAKLQPSLVTLNTLVNACVQCRRMDKISAIMEEMSSQGIAPDIITYSSIIKGYCQDGRLEQAFQVLDTVTRSTPLRPDEFTFNSLIDGCARACHFDRGMEVFDRMVEAGIKPSNFTLSVLVKLAGRCKQLGKAFELCEKITMNSGFTMNVHVYDNLVQACLNNGDCSRASGVLKTMVLAGVRPDTRTYKLLLGGAQQARDIRLSCELIRALAGLPNDLLGEEMCRTPLRPHGPLDMELISGSLDDVAAGLRGQDPGGVVGRLMRELRQLPGFRIDQRRTPHLAAVG